MVDVQWAFISIFTASLAHFILRIVLGRELGPEGLGVYTLAFTIYLFGMQFAAFGIGAALTKYVAEFIDDQATIRRFVSSGMTSSIITGTLMGVVLFLLAPYIAVSFFKVPELEGLLQLIAVCYPFIAIQKAVLGTLNGFRKMHLYALLTIVQNIAVVGVSITLVLSFHMGITGSVIGFVVPTIIISIFSLILIRNSLQKSFFWHIPALRETSVFGFYVVLGNSVSFINAQISVILMGYYLTPSEVGIYAVAVLFAQILMLTPSAVQSVISPITATLYGKGDINGIRNVIFSTMKQIFIVSVIITGFLVIFGQFLIAFLFSHEFVSAYIPLLILLCGNLIFSPFQAIATTLPSIGRVHIPFQITAICCILNLLLLIFLIPLFGLIGAALATTITLIISFTMFTFVLNSFLKSDLIRSGT